MFKRLFWLSVGFVAGSTTSFWVNRRMRQAIARYTPERLADDVTSKARSLGADLLDAAREGRDAMREREESLREGLHDGSARGA